MNCSVNTGQKAQYSYTDLTVFDAFSHQVTAPMEPSFKSFSDPFSCVEVAKSCISTSPFPGLLRRSTRIGKKALINPLSAINVRRGSSSCGSMG